MPDTSSKNKLLFDFYQNIKSDNEIFTTEDLEIAIKTLELAKEEIKLREQQRIRKAELEELESKAQNLDFKGKVLYLPQNLRHLKANAFKDNKEIVKVVINEACTDIGEYAFAGCTNLKEVVFPMDRVILRRGCFKGCSSIKEVFINDIANIGPSAFEKCISLENVFLPSDISNVYSKAFKDCHSLRTITFEDKSWYNSGCTSIFSKAFENCVSLESIEFTKCTSVDTESFINCSNLKEIYIHDNWVYQKQFKGCSAKIIKI